MDEDEALAVYVGRDEARAERAYGRLCELSRPFLHAYLRSALGEPQDREDVIQRVHLNLWKSRPQFKNQGVAAWYGLLKRIADRCLVDWLKAQRKQRLKGAAWPIEDLPDDAFPFVDDFMTSIAEVVQGGQFFHRASVLWLELDPNLSPEVHNRQLLAAQLYYLDEQPWESVVEMLDLRTPGATALDRDLLDSWLSHPGVLRYLAYDTLYHSNDQLASHLLGLPAPIEPPVLDTLMRRATSAQPPDAAPAGWTWDEVAVLLWRYRNALLLDQIYRRADCRLTQAEIEALLVRSKALFPFSCLTVKLLEQVENIGGAHARPLFAESGLWQRLAFQYRYHEELPHHDIHDRTDPAAQQVGYPLTPGMLNVWLSGGRLLRQLGEFCARKQGATGDD